MTYRCNNLQTYHQALAVIIQIIVAGTPFALIPAFLRLTDCTSHASDANVRVVRKEQEGSIFLHHRGDSYYRYRRCTCFFATFRALSLTKNML